jgi:hypothetical protein
MVLRQLGENTMKNTLTKIALTMLLLSAFTSCHSQVSSSTPGAHQGNEQVTQGIPQSIKAVEQRARESAKQWQSDAYLISAHAIVPASQSDGTFTIQDRITFNFRSKADAQHSYLVGFDSKGALDVFKFSDTVAQSDDLPIESNDWPLDSLDAWQIALANGGSALLKDYQQQTVDMRCSVSLQRWDPTLKPSRTGRVLWDVLCMDAVTQKSFRFWIDAQNGEVIKKALE